MGTELCRAVRGGGQSDARLGGDRIGLRALLGRFVCCEVVARQRAGQLVIAE